MSTFDPPLPDLQIAFHNRLSELRDVLLLDALLRTVGDSDLDVVNNQLDKLVGRESLRKVASWGLRGEMVFAAPCLLRANPHLLGYYRLLLGFSQKQFYGRNHGFGAFKSMEERGQIPKRLDDQLEAMCGALCRSSEYLVNGVAKLDKTAVHELTLLTLGPQLRGGALNLLGAQATERVFELIRNHVGAALVDSTDRSLKVRNAAGRIVSVEFAADPDICIREELSSGDLRNLVAIEIKGGKDISNIHNRIGEAEKSHQKARDSGFVECWTMVGVSRLDLDLATTESPSTDRFFRIDAVSDPSTSDFVEFREHLVARLGLRD